ncbi:hypothetical protein [Paenibacillus xylanilyticus]|uniref:Type II secretion system protein GspF domain-containing protein n=3 Tax=Paenibacillus TaxID=44249 RepID=A0A7Y6ES91_9BACL|nr:hypothetical protein [Paenibacillus xylanilyticus]NUU74677.1 hypothetical protein [Paenibacillus xylanilyticus]
MIYIIIGAIFFLILYVSLSTILSTGKTYRSMAYVPGSNEALWKRVAGSMEMAARSRIKLSSEQHSVLEKQLYRLGWKERPEDIAGQQLMFGGLALVGFSLFAIFTASSVMFILAIFIGFYFYRYPVSRLKKGLSEKERIAQEQLPDFIDHLILLFSAGLTPYAAIKVACDHAPEGLQLDCKRLSKDLESMSEARALEIFAENVGTPSVKRFVLAMKQAIQTSKEEAQHIFKSQTKLMRNIRKQNNRKIIKERPAKLQMISTGMYVFVLAVPVAVIAINFISQMNGIK